MATTSAIQHPTVQYRFGVEPMRPTRRLWQRFAPLIETLNAGFPDVYIQLDSALGYTEYLHRLNRSEYDFGIFEPHLVIEAEKLGYRVFARVAARDRIAGVIVVRAGAGLKSVRELRGQKIAFGSPDALASTMLVRLWLRQAGIRNRDIQTVFTGSQESALLDVFARTAFAAGASRVGWKEFQQTHPDQAAHLEVRWQTEDLSGPAVMAHRRVPAAHVRAVGRLLARLNEHPDGRAALLSTGFSGFRPAESGSYDDIWEFLNTYYATVGRRKAPR